MMLTFRGVVVLTSQLCTDHIWWDIDINMNLSGSARHQAGTNINWCQTNQWSPGSPLITVSTMFVLYINKNAKQQEHWLQYRLCRNREMDVVLARQAGQQICSISGFVLNPSSNNWWLEKGKVKKKINPTHIKLPSKMPELDRRDWRVWKWKKNKGETQQTSTEILFHKCFKNELLIKIIWNKNVSLFKSKNKSTFYCFLSQTL